MLPSAAPKPGGKGSTSKKKKKNADRFEEACRWWGGRITSGEKGKNLLWGQPQIASANSPRKSHLEKRLGGDYFYPYMDVSRRITYSSLPRE